MEKINCRRCVYYFVTWRQTQPHGCKRYGFESRLIPSMVVYNSSGSSCQFFQEKFKDK